MSERRVEQPFLFKNQQILICCLHQTHFYDLFNSLLEYLCLIQNRYNKLRVQLLLYTDE